jgi:4,5-dihydroxyphthalate decarboxylase
MSTVTRRHFLSTSTAASVLLAASRVETAGATRAPALTLTCANYVRFLPLAAGDVKPRELALTWIRGDRNEMLRRATDDSAVDGGESSMAQHVQRVDRGDRSLVAIPVFPLRNFTARDLYTRKAAPLGPDALGGRRIGIYNWAASGAVWYRHLVRYLGHDTRAIQWVVGGVDAPAAVRLPDPPLAHVRPAPDARSLSELLLAGDIDALFAPLPPRAHDAVNGPIVRVFADFKRVEQKYFAETGCYPPQHVVLLRRASWERDKAAARRLVDAVNESEAMFEAAQRQYPYNSPWLIGEVEDTVRVMGPAYHQHGLDANRRALDAFCQAAYEDGLTKRRVTVEEYFGDYAGAGAAGL